MQIELTPEFKNVINLFEQTRENYFLSGKAGSGKTTLINHWVATTTKKVIKLAPTGAAALQCNGQTIHSFFRFPFGFLEPERIKFIPRVAEVLDGVDTIILDEVSMIRADIMEGIDAALQKNTGNYSPYGGKQIIAVGDLYQLSPIVSKGEKEYFNAIYRSPYFFSARVYEQFPFKFLELSQVFRQKDPTFLTALNKIRDASADFNDLRPINNRVLIAPGNPMYLSSVNRRVDAINITRLAAIEGDMFCSEASINGDFSQKLYPAPKELRLKVGAKITTLINDSLGAFVNGSQLFVEEVDPDRGFIYAKGSNNETVIIEKVDWEIFDYEYDGEQLIRNVLGSFRQYPCMLGFARSIHKSQGTTYKEPIMINFENWFTAGMVYVALSRATDLENVFLSQRLVPMNLIVDPHIKQFYDTQDNILMKKEFDPWE